MEFKDVVDSRRSIRKFKEEKLTWDEVEQIIDSGRKAPASGNIQNTRIIVVTDELKKENIAHACLKQNWIAKAPVILVLCNDPDKIKSFYGERGIKLYSVQNCAAVAENILLAATNLGIASCWIGAFNEKGIKKSLRIPNDVSAEIIIPIGYRYPDVKPGKSFKIDLDKMIFHNEWKKTNRDVDFWPLYKQAERITEKIKEIKVNEFANDIKDKLSNIKNKLALWFIKRKI